VRLLTLCLALLLPFCAIAGTQQYEPLSASVQAALSHAISDQAPAKSSFPNSMEAIDWLSEMSRRLERRVPDRESRLELLRAVHYEATRAGLDPQLVLGLIQVESGFRKYTVSSTGARGFMQVMPFWIKVIGRNEDNRILCAAPGKNSGPIQAAEFPSQARSAVTSAFPAASLSFRA